MDFFQLRCCKRLTNLKNQFVFILALVLIVLIHFVIVLNTSSPYRITSEISCRFGINCLRTKNNWTNSWKYQPLEDWTINQMIDYIRWTNCSSCALAHGFGGAVAANIGLTGQKTVCLDPLVAPDKSFGYWPIAATNTSSECLVYSIGISNEWSFDEAMQKFGCRIYAFDPSMNMTNHNRSERIHFYNLGLSDRDETWPRKSPDQHDWKMMSLDSMYYKLLRHESKTIDYLKIDIDGGEWKALPQIMSSGMLDRVRQLGLEVHLIPEEKTRLKVIRKRVKLIKTLEDEYGFIRFDSKYAFWSREWKKLDDHDWIEYNSYEMAFYNSRLQRLSDEYLLETDRVSS